MIFIGLALIVAGGACGWYVSRAMHLNQIEKLQSELATFQRRCLEWQKLVAELEAKIKAPVLAARTADMETLKTKNLKIRDHQRRSLRHSAKRPKVAKGGKKCTRS